MAGNALTVDGQPFLHDLLALLHPGILPDLVHPKRQIILHKLQGQMLFVHSKPLRLHMYGILYRHRNPLFAVRTLQHDTAIVVARMQCPRIHVKNTLAKIAQEIILRQYSLLQGQKIPFHTYLQMSIPPAVSDDLQKLRRQARYVMIKKRFLFHDIFHRLLFPDLQQKFLYT